MSIYDDYNKPKVDLNNEIEFPITDQLSSLIDFDDNVIYITDVIEEPMLAHFIIKTRALIKKNNPATINVIINSAGGSVSEAWGIVDFMESSNVKFNTICRGAAWSAAAIILLGGTNRRFASKRSSIMLHQPMSSMDEFTKFSDLANLSLYATQQLDMLYDFISSRSNKDKNWWANTLRQDFWISAPEAQQLNIIDAII